MTSATQALNYGSDNQGVINAIGAYWDDHIHDLQIATQPIGSSGFFDELADYRFDKLHYLQEIVDFEGYKGKEVLEIGCGVGIDLALFAAGEANTTGIDLAQTSIDLAKKNFESKGLSGKFLKMNGEKMDFEDNSFDVVYAHGVLQYTADADQMVKEMYRILKPGGTAIMMVYNRISWLNGLSHLMSVGLEHEDAPVLIKYSIGEFKAMLSPFAKVEIIPERFPVKSRLHKSMKAILFNQFFVGFYNVLPRSMTRWSGWHLMAFAIKS